MPASWDIPVALDEENESYQVDILSGSIVVRTLPTTQSNVAYAASDEIADFGALQPTLSIRVYQLSATVGRGFAASATLTP
jgi:hypothetical protein